MTRSVITPFALILLGFFALGMLSIYVGGGLIILGIVLFVERRWPEQLKDDK